MSSARIQRQEHSTKMKTWILFICIVALMAPKISRAADEVDDWFRRRIAADVEERSIERRGETVWESDLKNVAVNGNK